MKKIFSVALILVLALSLFAGCGDKPAAPSSTPQTNPSVVSTPEPVEPVYNPNPLTGLENDGSYPVGQRLTAVMVNNIAACRPQRGLSDADVLFEIKVEGGITRFMALYADYKAMPSVGPVRSARDQFFQLILPFQPLYVHIGESVVQTQYVKDWNYEDFDLDGSQTVAIWHRDRNRLAQGFATEHTAYTSGEELTAYIEGENVDVSRTYNSPVFDFVNYNDNPRALAGGDAVKINIVHSQSYRTYFDWDASASKYLMSQYSSSTRSVTPTNDENNGAQLGFENVLVLFTDIHTYPGHSAKDLQEVVYGVGGVGMYFNGGKCEKIRWLKGSPDQVLRFVDADGHEIPVQINPGKSYVAVVDVDEAINFTYEDGSGSGTDVNTENIPEGDGSEVELGD